MSTGRRARFGRRGRERAWWLLAAAVLFAVLWVISPENFGPVELLFSTPRAGFLSTH